MCVHERVLCCASYTVHYMSVCIERVTYQPQVGFGEGGVASLPPSLPFMVYLVQCDVVLLIIFMIQGCHLYPSQPVHTYIRRVG